MLGVVTRVVMNGETSVAMSVRMSSMALVSTSVVMSALLSVLKLLAMGTMMCAALSLQTCVTMSVVMRHPVSTRYHRFLT